MRMRTLRGSLIALSALVMFGVSSGVAQAATTLDQTFDTGSTYGYGQVSSNSSQAQAFTAGISGALTSADLFLNYYGSPSGALNLTLRAASSNLPTGTALASTSVSLGAVSNAGGWVTFTFNSPYDVVAGTQYTLMLTSSTTTSNEYGWGQGLAAGNTGLNSISSSAGYGSWTADSTVSGRFRTYVTTADSGATPPPVMQQFGMPASGACDAAAPIVLNWGGAGSGGWGNSWAEWMNSGRGGAVCTRTLVYSNALGHWIVG
jgi:hypothetical protein